MNLYPTFDSLVEPLFDEMHHAILVDEMECFLFLHLRLDDGHEPISQGLFDRYFRWRFMGDFGCEVFILKRDGRAFGVLSRVVQVDVDVGALILLLDQDVLDFVDDARR